MAFSGVSYKEDFKLGRCHAGGVRNIAEHRSDDDYSRRALFRLDHLAGLASFSWEGMTSREENEIGPATEKGMPALSVYP